MDEAMVGPGDEGTELQRRRLVPDLERRDLLDRLEARDAAARKHMFWAAVGVSPGAAVPFLISLGQVGSSALLAGVALMSGFELWRAVRARREVSELEKALKDMRSSEDGTTAPSAD